MLRGRLGTGNAPPVLYSEESEKFLKRSVRALRVSCKCAGRGIVLFLPPIFVLMSAYLRGRLWAFRTIVSLTVLPLISTAAFLVEIVRSRKTLRRNRSSSFQSVLLFSMAAHAFAWWCIASVFSPASTLEKFYIQETKSVVPQLPPTNFPHHSKNGFGHLSWSELAINAPHERWTDEALSNTPLQVIVGAHLENLPHGVISVILAAYNEHKYAERTLESIVRATPPGILKEIIIVDDGSTPPMNTTYSADMYPEPLVRIKRNREREGLIRSKVFGAATAVGEVLVFLDAHVKPDPGWWLPILRHIKENPKRVVVPLIPVLDGDTWEVNRNAVGSKMMFEWDLSFHWFNDDNDWVPCMSGGLLAIHKDWWHLSGELDTGMYVWGGENIEQSIRIWLCGGEIVVARDSVIAHVFRPSFPYPVDGSAVQGNKQRTVEVWFDEYKEFFYESSNRSIRPPFKIPTIAEGGLADIPPGYDGPLKNVNERLMIRDKLKCKPFQSYIDRFHKVFRSRNMLPTVARQIHYGDSTMATPLCLTVDFKTIASDENRRLLKLNPCDNDNMSQWFVLDGNNSTVRSLALKGACLDAGIGEVTPAEWRTALINNVQKESSSEWIKPELPLNPRSLETYLCTEPNMNQQHWQFSNGQLYFAGACVVKVDDNNIALSHTCDAASWFISPSRLFSPKDLRHFS